MDTYNLTAVYDEYFTRFKALIHKLRGQDATQFRDEYFAASTPAQTDAVLRKWEAKSK